jgi:hypothetical protein
MVTWVSDHNEIDDRVVASEVVGDVVVGRPVLSPTHAVEQVVAP